MTVVTQSKRSEISNYVKYKGPQLPYLGGSNRFFPAA